MTRRGPHLIEYLPIIMLHRDAAEATGDEPEDADFDVPRIYEPASATVHLFIGGIKQLTCVA